MITALSTLADRRTPRLRLDRRAFLRFTGSLAAAASGGAELFAPAAAQALTTGALPPDPTEDSPGVQIKYTVCLQCHSACGLRVKVKDGQILKIDGNPYHPNNMEPEQRLRYATRTEDAVGAIGRVCVKPQAYVETLNSPLRLRGPLKRAGKRGEGKWISISWEQALDEIAARLAEYRGDELIDPRFPEFGPRSNQVVFAPGRYEHGQKEFTDRFWKNGFGTINYRHDHTSICEESHHIAGRLMTDGKKTHFKPDLANSEFVIWFGASPLEANFPAQTLGRKLMDMKARGGKIAVVDPRFSNTAAHADYWVPVRPGADASLAMGMAKWMIDNNRFDRRFLAAPSKAAAAKIDETTWSDATHLVDLQSGKFLRAPDAGVAGEAGDFVVRSGGRIVAASAADTADLEVAITVRERPAKSAFLLLRERLNEHSVEEYAAMAGVAPAQLVELAREFSAHGKKSAANPYRGPAQHTNGVYSVLAIHLLNILVGNFDWMGGNSAGGGTFNQQKGAGRPGQVDATKVPNGVVAKGVQITRVGARYDVDAPNLFARDGFPAKRPWFPFAALGNFQEIFPSINAGYPYPIKALIAYWSNWPYSTPAQRKIFEETVADESKLPLFVVFDIEMGETAAWADYVLPDTSILERWTTPHVSPAVLTRTDGWRQPVVGTFDDKPVDAPFDPDARNDYHPTVPGTRVIEDVFIELGKRLGLPGVGANAFEDGSALNNAWDWWRKLLVNESIEHGYSPKEILDRGGFFEEPGREYLDNGKLAHQYGGVLHIYQESLATTLDSMTGKPFDPLPKQEPVRDALDRPVVDEGFPFQTVTYKPIFHAQARTMVSPTLAAIMPTNWIEMNAADGRKLSLEDGDSVRVVSPDGVLEENVRVKLTEGMRPGVVAVAHSYGHWEMGSKRFQINGRNTAFRDRRGAGFTLNPILRVDPALGDVTLQDKIGGSASFFDTFVRIEKL